VGIGGEADSTALKQKSIRRFDSTRYEKERTITSKNCWAVHQLMRPPSKQGKMHVSGMNPIVVRRSACLFLAAFLSLLAAGSPMAQERREAGSFFRSAAPHHRHHGRFEGQHLHRREHGPAGSEVRIQGIFEPAVELNVIGRAQL
jgi:hypothetical protein